MPLKRCNEKGVSGWKWGDSGKCYKSKKDAIKQGIAIEGPDKFKKVASATELLTVYLKDETDNNEDCSNCSQ